MSFIGMTQKCMALAEIEKVKKQAIESQNILEGGIENDAIKESTS